MAGKPLKHIESLGVSPEFVYIVTIICRLYGYPIEKPVYTAQYFYALTPIKDDFYDLQKYLTYYFGSTTKTFTEVVQDVISMPEDQILKLKYTFADMQISDSEMVSEETSAPISKFASQAAKSKKPYIRILGKISPQLAAHNPRSVLPALFERLNQEDPETYSPEKLVKIFDDISEEVRKNDDQADSLHTIASQVLIQAGYDKNFVVTVADQLLIFTLAYPQASESEIKDFVRIHLLPQLDAKSGNVDSSPEEIAALTASAVMEHEEARLSQEEKPTEEKESVKGYISKLESKTAPEIATVGALVALSPETNRYILTDRGRSMADRYTLGHIKNGRINLDSALEDLKIEKSKINHRIEVLYKSGEATPEIKTELGELYEKKRYLELLSSSVRIRKIHLDRLSRSPEDRTTALENNLVAQYVEAGLSPEESRKLARAYINSGLAAANQYLSEFSDPDPKKRQSVANELHSQGLEHLSQKRPDLINTIKKLKNFKFDSAKFTKSFNNISEFRNLLSNPGNLFKNTAVQEFIQNQAQNFLAKQLQSELVQKTIAKFASSEIGKKVLGAVAKKVTEEAVKRGLQIGLEVGAEAAASSTLVGIVAVVGYEAVKKLKKFVQNITSDLKIKVRKNLPVFLGAFITLVLAPFVGVGTALAAGITGGVTVGVGGGVIKTVTGNPGANIQSGASNINATLTALTTELAADSVSGVAIVIMAIPVVIALILFIINTSAYIIPLSTTSSGIGGATPSCWPIHASITQDPCSATMGLALCDDPKTPIVEICSHQTGIDMNAFDLGAVIGTPVYATHNGSVAVEIDAGSDTTGYGNHIIIASDTGNFYTLYAHLSAFLVGQGDKITAGDPIAYSGNTSSFGKVFGAHLHYELRTGNPDSSQGLCDLVDYVPIGWHVGGTTDYPGTCYANESGGITLP